MLYRSTTEMTIAIVKPNTMTTKPTLKICTDFVMENAICVLMVARSSFNTSLMISMKYFFIFLIILATLREFCFSFFNILFSINTSPRKNCKGSYALSNTTFLKRTLNRRKRTTRPPRGTYYIWTNRFPLFLLNLY